MFTSFRDYEIILGTATTSATDAQTAASAARLRAAGIDPEDTDAVRDAYEAHLFEAAGG